MTRKITGVLLVALILGGCGAHDGSHTPLAQPLSSANSQASGRLGDAAWSLTVTPPASSGSPETGTAAKCIAVTIRDVRSSFTYQNPGTCLSLEPDEDLFVVERNRGLGSKLPIAYVTGLASTAISRVELQLVSGHVIPAHLVNGVFIAVFQSSDNPQSLRAWTGNGIQTGCSFDSPMNACGP